MIPAFEIIPMTLCPPWQWVGDLNGDYAVNVPDLLILLRNWGAYGVQDLLAMLDNWGDWTGWGVVFDGTAPYASEGFEWC